MDYGGHECPFCGHHYNHSAICLYQQICDLDKPTIKIKPNPNCEICGGSGEVFDWVAYGTTNISETNLCNCILAQLPENYNDEEIELDVNNG